VAEAEREDNAHETNQVSVRSDLGPVMMPLTIPNHPELIEALGRLAMAHTQLELVLGYTVRTIFQPVKQRSLMPYWARHQA
jgi:hypothetical protein